MMQKKIQIEWHRNMNDYILKNKPVTYLARPIPLYNTRVNNLE